MRFIEPKEFDKDAGVLLLLCACALPLICIDMDNDDLYGPVPVKRMMAILDEDLPDVSGPSDMQGNMEILPFFF